MTSATLAQIGIAVSDVETTARSLSQSLGITNWDFKSWDSSKIHPKRTIHKGRPNPDWKANLAFASLGDMQIELIQNVAGASGYAEFVERKGYGLRHIMFLLDD